MRAMTKWVSKIDDIPREILREAFQIYLITVNRKYIVFETEILSKLHPRDMSNNT